MKKQNETQPHEQIAPNIEVIQHNAFSWVNVSKTTKKEIRFLEEEFSLNINELQDALPELQRPKIAVHEDYIFMVLLFPIHQPSKQMVSAAKISFFIFPGMIITIHNNKLLPLAEILERVKTFSDPNASINLLSPKTFIPRLLLGLYDYTLPITNVLANHIDAIEDDIFSASLANTKIVQQLFSIERQVVDFRKIMRNHQMIIGKLLSALLEQTKGRAIQSQVQELTEYPQIIWTYLESDIEAIDTLRQTYESLTSFYLNDILKTLTIVSIIFAPMAIMGAVWGMNFRFIPLATHPAGFTIMILVMLLISGLTFVFFKYKKWF